MFTGPAEHPSSAFNGKMWRAEYIFILTGRFLSSKWIKYRKSIPVPALQASWLAGESRRGDEVRFSTPKLYNLFMDGADE